MAGYGGGSVGWKQNAKFDWNKISVEGGTPPPMGVYSAKVESADIALTSKGDPMIKVKIKLTGAEEPELREDGVGKVVYDNWVCTPEGAFKMKQFAVVAGMIDDLPESQQPDDVNAFAQKAVGAELDLMIRHRSYQGKPQPDIQHYGAEPPKDEDANGKSKPRTSSGGGRRR